MPTSPASSNGTKPSGVFNRALGQVSRSGTPNRGGVSRPDDYVVELADPVRRMAIFEEMRSSDDGVQSAVDTREKLILASNWALNAGADDPGSTTIKEFCEDNIYPLIDDCLRWLGGGALQYGFGMVEPVFAYADGPRVKTIVRGEKATPTKKYGRKIFLQKLAHIRQRTIATFILDEASGDLKAARQFAWNGYQFKQVDIDAERLLFWTYNRQGDDYWGVPPMRNIYKAWTFKNQLERLNILGIDRFGTGIPVAEAGPGWGDADFERMDVYLENWRSGEDNYLVHPAGGKIEIKSANGQMTMATLDWVKYYNLAITKAYYTQGSELGSTETGARALGEIMLASLETIVQADAEALANVINEKLVVPMVIMNFGEQEIYPRFEPRQRVRGSAEFATAISTMISSKSWRPEDESWYRDIMKMPTVSVEDLKRLAEERQAKALEIAKTAAGIGGGPTPPGGEPSDNPPSPPMPTQSHNRTAGLQLARPTDAPDAAGPQETWRTHEFSTWENEVVKPGILMRDLDLETSRATAELADTLAGIDDQLATAVREAASGGTDALSAAVRTIAVPAGARAKLRKVLLQAAERAADVGTEAVMRESMRMKAIEDPNAATPIARSAWESLVGYVRRRDKTTALAAANSPEVAAAIERQTAELARLAGRAVAPASAPTVKIEKGAIELHVHNEAGKPGDKKVSIRRADGSEITGTIKEE
jgi:hypothetical protein